MCIAHSDVTVGLAVVVRAAPAYAFPAGRGHARAWRGRFSRPSARMAAWPVPPHRSATPRAGSSGTSCHRRSATSSSAAAAPPSSTAHTRNRGFTPGFASVLECEDGSRHFVKAASLRAQGDLRRGLPRGGAQAGGAARRRTGTAAAVVLRRRVGRARHRSRRRTPPQPALDRRRPRRLPGRAGGRRLAADPGAGGPGAGPGRRRVRAVPRPLGAGAGSLTRTCPISSEAVGARRPLRRGRGR